MCKGVKLMWIFNIFKRISKSEIVGKTKDKELLYFEESYKKCRKKYD